MGLMTPSSLREAARSMFQTAKEKGLIPTHAGLFCADCGNHADGYDHRNYIEYLVVDPICNSCNAKRGQGWPPTDHEPVEVSWYSGPPPEEMVVYGFIRLKWPWEMKK